MLEIYQPLQDYPKAEYDESYFSNENLEWKYQIFRSYQFEVSDLVPELTNLGFVKEALIFQTWNLGILFGQNYAPT